MADFLTRMTQRTLGLLPVVQPIIASKFGSESMGADMQGGLSPIEPGQAVEESFEDWEEGAERIPPAPIPQSVAPRRGHIPATPVPGMPPSAAIPQQQPSTPKAQQTKPAPVRPHEVQPLQQTTGEDLPPLVPQPQNWPVYNENSQLVSRPPVDNSPPVNKHVPPIASNSSAVVSSQSQVSYSQEKQPFSAAPTEHKHATSIIGATSELESSQPQTSNRQGNQPFSDVPTTKPRRGQGKPSSQSDVGTRFIATGTGEPLVLTQSGEVPQISQMPHGSTQAVPHKSSIEKQRIFSSGDESSPHGSIQGASRNEGSHVREDPSVSNFNTESPTLVSPASPISANTTGHLPAKGRNVENTKPGQPLSYTEHDTHQYRVRAGLAPALEGVRSIARPSGVSPALVAKSSIVEPGFPSIYPSIHTRQTEITAAGKRAAAQLPESHDAPTIKVTIGRIEVRAVTPTPTPPAPVKAQRSQPTLSLDDYLKQRNGG